MPAATLTESSKQGAPTASTALAVIKTQQPAAWSLHLPRGERVTIRAARPDDAEMLQAYVRELSERARYNRFFGPVRELPQAELIRITHMNQPSRATLIAEIDSSEPVMIGELRYAVLSDAACEFAISVAEKWRGKGIGSLMLGDLQCRVRALGVESLVGDVLCSNDAGICPQGRFRYRGAIRRSASGADREGYLRPANRAL